MTTKNAFQPLQPVVADPEPARPRQGPFVLLVLGLALLAATAAAGRYYWADDNPQAAVDYPSIIPEDHAPQVWIWSPEDNAPAGFAGLERPEASLVNLPGHAPLPRITESYVASQTAVTARAIRAEPVVPGSADNAASDNATPSIAAPESLVAPRPVVLAGPPPSVPPQRPLPAPVIASVTPIDEGLQVDGGLQAGPGLARSLLPLARPQSIMLLAGLTVSAPQEQPVVAPTAVLAAQETPARASNGQNNCPVNLTSAIPRRPAAAPGGQAAIARLGTGAGPTRDNAVAQAITGGNLPDFLRHLVPVTLSGTGGDGRPAQITLCVMPDYLALGSDRDFVRVPLGLPAARLIAERFDMALPTTRMVDAIHAQASLRLRPSPMTPGAQMVSTDYFLRHNATLEGQRRNAGGTLGMLVSGHKKDLVLSNRLERNPGRVAIYGWHQANGQPIQPLSTIHGAGYADYSHGTRLVSRTAYINGQAVDLRDLLSDQRYAGLISDEGTITARLILAALR